MHIVSQMTTVLQRTLNVTKITANVSRDMPSGLRTELVCLVCKYGGPEGTYCNYVMILKPQNSILWEYDTFPFS